MLRAPIRAAIANPCGRSHLGAPAHSAPGAWPGVGVGERVRAVARSDDVKALLRSNQRGDEAGLQRAAKDLIDDERRKCHDLVADQLEAIPEEPGRRPRPLRVSSLRPVPKTRDDVPLISMEEPRLTSQDLSPARSSDPGPRLAGRGVPPAFGAAGSRGRTAIEPPTGGAARLRQVGQCRGDGRTSRPSRGPRPVGHGRVVVLGETARKLDQIFSLLDAGSWVLISDELDMLGRERADAASRTLL